MKIGKKAFMAALFMTAGLGVSAQNVDLFSYATPDGKSGLRLAWRADSTAAWQPIGGDYNFVSSDFGPWGSHKKMFAPRLIKDASTGMWAATWIADPDGQVVALAVSPDLMKWEPQRYYASELDLPRDMRPAVPVVADSAVVDGAKLAGWRQQVSQADVDRLTEYVAHRRDLERKHGQLAKDDAVRFGSMAPLTFRATAKPADAKQISDKLIGIFFEDINYAADGGLYAEMVQNRDFEYTPADRKGDRKWNATHSWTAEGGTMTIDTVSPLHANNSHYARFDGTSGAMSISNAGWDGMALKRGETYKFSMWARAAAKTCVTVALITADGRNVGSARVTLKPSGSEWQKYTAQVKCKADASGASLRLTIPAGAKLDADMISLFPSHTFRGRENGLRADLAQTLADMKPRFVRFPGGCVAHGNGIDNIYDWKGSIGPLEARKPLRNIWNYHQTRGLGYHEYFLFCEDLGAEPLPVLSAGVPCQNSGIGAHHSHHALTTLGQQCGIPMDEMAAYVQDVLDLIEYANGGTDTRWGAERAKAGHPEPFNMKYIGIGNEDLISEVFVPRFKMIYDAVRERYPDITVVGTVGPFYEGSDYDAGWKLARELSIPMVDEHYYVSPGWMIHNQDYYDDYRRQGTKVYLGEYAAHVPGRLSNMETALAEALYLTSVERNADVVEMTSYAPLLAKKGHTQWRPDLIYFTNDSVMPTTDYYVQQLYGNNSGTTYVPVDMNLTTADADAAARVGMSIVKDEDTGDYIVKLVNMLSVEVKGDVDLTPLGIKSAAAAGWRMQGAPQDAAVTPQPVKAALPHLALPPYSFTVLRVK